MLKCWTTFYFSAPHSRRFAPGMLSGEGLSSACGHGGALKKKLLERWNLREGGIFDSAGKASVIGLHLVSGMAVGGIIGYFLDKWLHTSPWMKLIFFILGVIAGFRNVYLDTKLLLKAQEKKNDSTPKSGD
jgi:ATP synthase protein I